MPIETLPSGRFLDQLLMFIRAFLQQISFQILVRGLVQRLNELFRFTGHGSNRLRAAVLVDGC